MMICYYSSEYGLVTSGLTNAWNLNLCTVGTQMPLCLWLQLDTLSMLSSSQLSSTGIPGMIVERLVPRIVTWLFQFWKECCSSYFPLSSLCALHCFSQVGGWSQVYKGLTFVTVTGAGHEVPLHRPRQAFILFRSFLQNKPMPRWPTPWSLLTQFRSSSIHKGRPCFKMGKPESCLVIFFSPLSMSIPSQFLAINLVILQLG